MRRKKRLQSAKAKKGSKKPKVDWKWWQSDGAGTGFKAITRDVTTTEMKHMTFKEYLQETVGGMYLQNTSFAAPNMPSTDENWDEDWSDDITDDGTSTGICPKCGGHADYNMTGKTLADARAFWECEDCGHQGPKESY